MKNIMFGVGLPRSGSTLIMNILNENPEIYSTGTCPLPYIYHFLKKLSNEVHEFNAMDMDVLDESLSNFLKHGTQGWYETQTKKFNVISKSRLWNLNYRFIFRIYENPKFIYFLRDPRDIICSLEKLMSKYPHVNVGTHEIPFELRSFDKRIELHCTDVTSTLGRPLSLIHNDIEFIKKFPNNFFILRWEDFCYNPKKILKDLYFFLEIPYFDHDLDHIPPPDYYEHDPSYRTLVSHKTRSKFVPIPPQWPKIFSENQSLTVLHNLKEFYSFFYPEYYYNNEK